MTIAYQIASSLYLNLTNKCPCACTFCLRANGDGVDGSPSLWLDREPTVDEVMAAIASHGMNDIGEIVFCGYGEPTERFDAVVEISRRLKASAQPPRIRLNTNGLADLINGRKCAALLKGLVDTVSVSLNTDNPDEYLAVCRPAFGEAAYPAMLAFAADAAAAGIDTVMSVVGEPVTDKAKQERCRRIAEGLGAKLRVRPYQDGAAPQAASH